MTRCPGNKHYSRIKPSSIPPLSGSGPGATVLPLLHTPVNSNNGNGSNTSMSSGSARPLSVSAPSGHRDSNNKGSRPRLKSTEEYLDDDDNAAMTDDRSVTPPLASPSIAETSGVIPPGLGQRISPPQPLSLASRTTSDDGHNNKTSPTLPGIHSYHFI
jgi:transglutaminase/protease-like cytokinesis protein 3